MTTPEELKIAQEAAERARSDRERTQEIYQAGQKAVEESKSLLEKMKRQSVKPEGGYA
jgi:hypothetical protein